MSVSSLHYHCMISTSHYIICYIMVMPSCHHYIISIPSHHHYASIYHKYISASPQASYIMDHCHLYTIITSAPHHYIIIMLSQSITGTQQHIIKVIRTSSVHYKSSISSPCCNYAITISWHQFIIAMSLFYHCCIISNHHCIVIMLPVHYHCSTTHHHHIVSIPGKRAVMNDWIFSWTKKLVLRRRK